MNIVIRKFKSEDLNDIVSIWNEVIDEGESFFWKDYFSTDTISGILKNQKAVYCSVFDNEVVGFYILHDNFPGRGSHISNALYAIRKEYRGKGIGKMLGEHSLKISKECGYKAMQFNSVVSTNTASISLWEGLGFVRIGEIKHAFIKDDNEVADIYIYNKSL
ncbi:MAG: N-acetyltransferase [Bacillota bacterium]|nr:N-acetyltransferase [Bacillota bacterium]